jgi:hypothetical protein
LIAQRGAGRAVQLDGYATAESLLVIGDREMAGYGGAATGNVCMRM